MVAVPDTAPGRSLRSSLDETIADELASHEMPREYVFVDELPRGRHLLFVHGGVIRILTQDLGLDRFVATGSVVGVDWTRRELLFVNEPQRRFVVAPKSDLALGR